METYFKKWRKTKNKIYGGNNFFVPNLEKKVKMKRVKKGHLQQLFCIIEGLSLIFYLKKFLETAHRGTSAKFIFFYTYTLLSISTWIFLYRNDTDRLCNFKKKRKRKGKLYLSTPLSVAKPMWKPGLRKVSSLS